MILACGEAGNVDVSAVFGGAGSPKDWARLLENTADSKKLIVGQVGDIAVVVRDPARIDRPGVAVPEETDEPVAAPAGSGCLQAWNVPLALWFEMLAATSGKRLAAEKLAPCRIVGDVEASLWQVTADDALAASAKAFGYGLMDAGDGRVFVFDRDPASRKAPPPEQEPRKLDDLPPAVELPDGRMVVVPFKGTAVFADTSKNRAILSGRVYQVGDELLDAHGKPVRGPLRVAKIDSGAVELEVGAAGGPRVTVKPS